MILCKKQEAIASFGPKKKHHLLVIIKKYTESVLQMPFQIDRNAARATMVLNRP